MGNFKYVWDNLDCESTFPLNFMKFKYRSSISDENLVSKWTHAASIKHRLSKRLGRKKKKEHK